MKSLRALAAVALFACIGTSGGWAQSSAAPPPPFESTIAGRVVVDGLAVPGVTVTVTDPASGQKYVTSTDERGRFVARVGHAGTYLIQTAMAAFAPSQAEVVVPASGVAPAALAINLSLVSNTAVAAANPTPGTPDRRLRASTATPPDRVRTAVAANGRAGSATGRAGRAGRGGNQGSDLNGFQQLDVTQTGDLTGDTAASADAGAADSGVAGMNENAATDSAVVTGTASQDERPMTADAMGVFLRNGGGGDFGGGGFGGGRGGFAGGRGGGGFGGGRGGFSFRQLNNRFNQPHGSLSYSLSDSALNALPDSITGTSSTQSPPNAANQRYSAVVTTPFRIPHIYDDKGKTSLTVSFFGTHDASLNNVSALVPTLNERQGNFQGVTDARGNPVIVSDPTTGQPFGNNTLTSINPAAKALLAYFPVPTPGAVGRFNYTNTINDLNTSHNLGLRVNHSFGAAPQGGRGRGFFNRGRTINFNLNYSGGNASRPGVFFPFNEGFTRTRGINLGLGYTQPVGGWINIARINFNRNRTNLTNLYAGNQNIAGLAGIAGVSTAPVDWGLPTLSFATSGLTSLSDTNPNFLRTQTWSVSDSLVRRMGRHNLRLGGDYRWLQNNPETAAQPRGAFSFDGQYSGYDLADFLLGLPQQTSERFGGGVFHFRQSEPDLFFNDNWQMKSTFTLSYGLRWEYISPYTELDNRLTNLLVGPGFSSVTPVIAGQAGVPDSVLQPDYRHLRPSLGFAWKSWDNMIVRGGFGMAYNTGAYGGMATALAYQSPFITTQSNLGGKTTPLSLTNGFPNPSATVNSYGVNPDYAVGYSYLWNLGVQRQIGRSYLLNLEYNGSKGSQLDQLLAPNRTPSGLLNPNLPPFLYDTTGGNSIYHGGTVIMSRRLSQSVSFRARYTYSKMLDDASQIGGSGGLSGAIAQNPQDLAAERALSNQNVTSRFNADYEWQLPYGLNHRWGDHASFWSSALGDWQLSGSFEANSGQPFTPLVNNIQASAQGLQSLGVSAPLRANLTGTPIALAQPTLTQFFNVAAFAEPASGTYGDAGRNIIIGPGQVLLNLDLSKNFRMGEFRTLELRFDGSNALNHPNWAGVDTNFNSSTFGAITSFGSPRQITFSSRFRF